MIVSQSEPKTSNQHADLKPGGPSGGSEEGRDTDLQPGGRSMGQRGVTRSQARDEDPPLSSSYGALTFHLHSSSPSLTLEVTITTNPLLLRPFSGRPYGLLSSSFSKSPEIPNYIIDPLYIILYHRHPYFNYFHSLSASLPLSLHL